MNKKRRYSLTFLAVVMALLCAVQFAAAADARLVNFGRQDNVLDLKPFLAPYRANALDAHPWREWASVDWEQMQRRPGMGSRWSQGKDLSWEPVRIELVSEVKYDHMQRDRFRHAAIFQRWRPDKQPRDCTYAQLEVTAPYELEKIFAASQRR